MAGESAACMTLLHDCPLFTTVSFTMITLAGQSSTARAHLPIVLTVHLTSFEKMKAPLQCLYITAFTDRRDESGGF